MTVALITDAGTPGISDPGEELVAMCYEEQIPVTSLPGPAACVTALTISGLPTRRFCFEAFLPSDKKERRRILEELKEETRTIVIYEAPHRLAKTLGELEEALGDRQMSLVRELTKKHETVHRSSVSRLKSQVQEEPVRGECVLVIAGKSLEEIQADMAEDGWQVLDELGDAAAGSGDYAGAVSYYDASLRINGDNPGVMYDKAMSLKAQGQEDEADDLFGQIIDSYPDTDYAVMSREQRGY